MGKYLDISGLLTFKDGIIEYVNNSCIDNIFDILNIEIVTDEEFKDIEQDDYMPITDILIVNNKLYFIRKTNKIIIYNDNNYKGLINYTNINNEDNPYFFITDKKITLIDIDKNISSITFEIYNTPNITMSYMFSNCNVLTEVNFIIFNTFNVTDTSYMFYNCRELYKLNLGIFDMSNVTNTNRMFLYCYMLQIITGQIIGLKKSIDLQYSALNNESIMVFINGVTDVLSVQRIQISAKTYNTLTEEQITIATSKGWTVVV